MIFGNNLGHDIFVEGGCSDSLSTLCSRGHEISGNIAIGEGATGTSNTFDWLKIQDSAANTIGNDVVRSGGQGGITYKYGIEFQGPNRAELNDAVTGFNINGTFGTGYILGAANTSCANNLDPANNCTFKIPSFFGAANFVWAETTAPAANSGFDTCYGDSTAHAVKCSYNNGAFQFVPQSVTAQTFDAVYGTYRVTADQTITAGASLTNIPGLSWTMPANTALNVAFECTILYNETTAATSMQFGIQDVTVAPTSLMAEAQLDTSATAFTAGNVPALTTTTATAIVTATPSAATTIFSTYISGMIEQPSNASSSAINIMAQFTTNNGTIKRGSYCRVW